MTIRSEMPPDSKGYSIEQHNYSPRYRETTLVFDDERQESRDIRTSNFPSKKLAISNSKIQVDEWFSELRRTFALLMRSLAWETIRGIGNQMAEKKGQSAWEASLRMNENCLSAVEINQDLCGRCTICYSICPFQAIDRDASTGKVEINIQKCQVCGLCYSACAAGAINIAYYDNNSLLDYVESAMEQIKADTLVIMCRGNSPSSLEVADILSAKGMGVDRYIPLRLPCAGRLSMSFIFSALELGIKNIISIQCEDKFCRMKVGSNIETHRLILGRMLLEQLGYPGDAIKVVKYSHQAVWDNDKCVGCDKCAFICPYGAIDLEPFSSPTINRNECVGCGACQLVCPHHAIQLRGFEFDRIHASYGEAAKLMKVKNNEPTILIFSCQWSDYSVLDNPQKILEGRNAAVLEVPCFKGMDPVHVVNSFLNGFDGVMGVICSESDCKLNEGRDVADRQLEVLRRVLERLGLEDRFEIFELSPRCQGEFQEKYEAFAKKIGQMPQLPAKEKVTKCTE